MYWIQPSKDTCTNSSAVGWQILHSDTTFRIRKLKKKIIIEVRYELNVNYLAIILEHIYLFHMYMQYIIVGSMIGNIKVIANFLR